MYAEDEAGSGQLAVGLLIAQGLTDGVFRTLFHLAGVLANAERHRRRVQFAVDVAVLVAAHGSVGPEPVAVAVGRRAAAHRGERLGVQRVEHHLAHGGTGSGVGDHLRGNVGCGQLEGGAQLCQRPSADGDGHGIVAVQLGQIDVVGQRDVAHLAAVNRGTDVDRGP